MNGHFLWRKPGFSGGQRAKKYVSMYREYVVLDYTWCFCIYKTWIIRQHSKVVVYFTITISDGNFGEKVAAEVFKQWGNIYSYLISKMIIIWKMSKVWSINQFHIYKKVCDNGTLVQILRFWALSIVIVFI
jgi:hypothetical protein